MRIKIYTLLIFVIAFSGLKAQSLSAGDIAFIAINTDGDDNWSWVALTDIPSGTVIYFTDDKYVNTMGASGVVGLGGSEATITYTLSSTIPSGTVVNVTNNGGTFSPLHGTISATGPMGISVGGDNLFAYQGSASSPTFIAGILIDYNYSVYNSVTKWGDDGSSTLGANSSELPPGLTNGQTAVSLFPGITEKDNARYIGTLSGSQADLLAAINNYVNWESTDNTVNYQFTRGDFSVSSGCSITASISSQTNVACNGDNTGDLTVTTSNGAANYSYVWSNTSTTSNTSSTSNGISSLAAGTYTVTVIDGNGCTATASATITQPTALSATVVVDSNVSCNGLSDGGLTASYSGGAGPYTYSWSNGATTSSIRGLAVGTYSVTVTDANDCTATNNGTITEPTVLSVSAIVDANESCNGLADGAARAQASGGAAPYTYLWSNTATTSSITGLSAGTYNVTVTDDNGCTATQSATITQPSAINVSAIITDESCSGEGDGAIDITISGGQSPYTYSWSNSASTEDVSGLSGGTYSVTIADNNGCTATLSKTITNPAALDAGEIQ